MKQPDEKKDHNQDKENFEKTKDAIQPDKKEGEYDPDEASHNPGYINDNEIIKALSLQMKDATNRSRGSLIALLITSLIITISAFNFRGTWLFTREFRAHKVEWNENLRDAINTDAYINKDEALVDALNRISENNNPIYKRDLYHGILDGTFKTVDIPPLGIEFYVEDMPLLGAFGLSMVLLWFFFVRRREVGVVKAIIAKAKNSTGKHSLKVTEFLYNSIAYSQILNKVNKSDDHDNQHTYPLPERLKSFFKVLMIALKILLIYDFKEDVKKIKENFKLMLNPKNHKNRVNQYEYIKYILKTGFYLPSMVLAVVIVFDIYETFFKPVERYWIPNENFIHEYNNYSDCNGMFTTPLSERVADSIMKSKYDSVKFYYMQTLCDVKDDTANNCIWQYQKKICIKNILTEMNDSIIKIKKHYYRHPTFFRYSIYSKKTFEEMNHESLRFFGFMTMPVELLLVRTIIPIILIRLCFLLTWRSVKLGRERDKDFCDFESYYEKKIDEEKKTDAQKTTINEPSKNDKSP